MQAHIPYFGGYILFGSQASRFYPYVFGPETFDTVYRNTVFALRDRGYFSASSGFKKLGFIYRSCDTQLISEFNAWLRQAGLTDSQIVTYDVGCPSAFSSPADIEQAGAIRELLDLCGVGLTLELVMYTPHAAFITGCRYACLLARLAVYSSGVTHSYSIDPCSISSGSTAKGIQIL